MTAYYNEFDPFAAAWLRELIKAGLISNGDVDERSIVDVRPSDLSGYTQCHFFAGIGVWSHALRQAGWPDDKPVWTGSCPCQPFSRANTVYGRRGKQDERHLWPYWKALIAERKPPVVFGEQVTDAIAGGWMDEVADDMERLDYAVGAATMPALGIGSPQERMRLWFVCHANDERLQGVGISEAFAGKNGGISAWGEVAGTGNPYRGKRWITKPGLRLLANGSATHVGRVRGYGNAIVGPLATAFIQSACEAIGDLVPANDNHFNRSTSAKASHA
ncbi:DNA cytosine methyltransferase [Mesorhizobium sp. BR1-1-3]|uniref:DNA cytosine methyltransferase n=1 Tax=Mesorhizobium sp. BR1-1-3 TaxID=2876651 RepID=UPI001CD18AF7|nr:DNA cytosine methyltransferase [Mesorhizobium sp. BR1-1-3]MBZ9888103.1 DNA cytosine methyltransferase [Mesorhizobium sp. BR1-1-3]